MTNPAILEALVKAISAAYDDALMHGEREAAAAVLELIRPRKLEWTKHDYGTTTAKAQVGIYRACEPNSGGLWAWWLYSWWPRSGCILAEGIPQGYPSLEAAQAAAQSHADAAHWNNTPLGKLVGVA